eukprot:1157694-Pelagomonas_calceolata.AAC.12
MEGTINGCYTGPQTMQTRWASWGPQEHGLVIWPVVFCKLVHVQAPLKKTAIQLTVQAFRWCWHEKEASSLIQVDTYPGKGGTPTPEVDQTPTQTPVKLTLELLGPPLKQCATIVLKTRRAHTPEQARAFAAAGTSASIFCNKNKCTHTAAGNKIMLIAPAELRLSSHNNGPLTHLGVGCAHAAVRRRLRQEQARAPCSSSSRLDGSGGCACSAVQCACSASRAAPRAGPGPRPHVSAAAASCAARSNAGGGGTMAGPPMGLSLGGAAAPSSGSVT